MEETIEAVRKVLSVSFPNSVSDLEETVPGRKVGGSLITEEFLGMEQIERQRLLWRVLRERLSAQDQLRLGTIITLTPQEVAAMEDVAVAA